MEHRCDRLEEVHPLRMNDAIGLNIKAIQEMPIGARLKTQVKEKI